MKIFTVVLLKITKEIIVYLDNIKEENNIEIAAIKAFDQLSKVFENNKMSDIEKEDEAIEILKQFYIDCKK